MTEQAVVQWITDYGYFGIFFLLIFGIIGLPIPDGWLLVIWGYLAFKNVLGLFPTLAIAALGGAWGLTVGYYVGRHVNWHYSSLAIVAVAIVVTLTVSGLPFRMASRIKNKLAAAAA